MSKMSLKTILATLKSKRLSERETAIEKLEVMANKGLSLSQGKMVLRAAAEKYPLRKYSFLDTSTTLVEVAAAKPFPDYIPIILELFPQYNDGAKTQSLYMLSIMPEREAAEAYLKLLDSFAQKGGIPYLILGDVEQTSRHVEVFFPALLNFTRLPKFRYSIYLLLLSFLQKGLLQQEQIHSHLKSLYSAYAKCEEKLMAQQQSSGIAWMWRARYSTLRADAALYLDLLGYLSGKETIQFLRNALKYSDPRLKYFAVVSLLRLGQPVAAKHITEVAASAEIRGHFFNELGKMGKNHLFPKKFKNQKALAETNMVSWLTYPTELGRVPDEIELMNIISTKLEDSSEIADYYIYRFRNFKPGAFGKKGWLAGISGPYLLNTGLSVDSATDTFSCFESWDSKLPEEHLGDVIQLVGDVTKKSFS